ncbi:MAG: hypothetical protein QM639_06935, partial [Rhodocyclaceae bacterium]
MKRLFALATALLLTACSAIHGDYPRSGSVIPDAGIRLTPGYVLHFDDAIMIAGIVYLVYQVVDPRAPNWDIRETQMDQTRYRYEMQMQPIHIGG